MRPILSQHAKDRLRERHGRYLPQCNSEAEFNKACYELLNKAKVTKRHLNDHAFMVRIQEKYGYTPITFMEYENILFLIRELTVVTVLDTDTQRGSKQHGRVLRFNPKRRVHTYRQTR